MYRLIPPWNIVSFLKSFMLQQTMLCVLFGQVRIKYSSIWQSPEVASVVIEVMLVVVEEVATAAAV